MVVTKDYFVSGGMDYHLKISGRKEYDLDFTVLQSKQIVNPPAIYSLSMNPSQTKLAVGLGNCQIAIINPATGKVTNQLEEHLYVVNQVYVFHF